MEIDEKSLTYVIGTSGTVIAFLFAIIAYWFKDLLTKVSMITAVIKDIEYLKEKFQDLKAPIEKIDKLDREVGTLQRDLKTAFGRVDDLKSAQNELRRDFYKITKE